MSIALCIEDLSIVRGGRRLISGLSHRLEGGAVLGLEGPNGAGKTSLLRAIAGLLPPASGSITVHQDGAIVDDREERASFIGWLSHLDGIKAQLTVREQAQFWAEIYQSSRDVDAALVRFGLGSLSEARGVVLSAGQKRRLALVRLVLAARPLWLLDEPLAALDTRGKALVAEAITDHAAGGGIVVAATHEALGVQSERLAIGAA